MGVEKSGWRMSVALASLTVGVWAGSAQAAIVGVGQLGGDSNLGVAAAIIPAPPAVLDDTVTNRGMQGFNEAQGVVTSVAHATDPGFASIAANMKVDSHMIFLNSAGGTLLTHSGVVWRFDGMIIGVMSDTGGTLEAASSSELGAPGTNYTVTGPGTGAAAPFSARGLEGNNGTGVGTDGYTLLDPFTLKVAMRVSEPGDWIRVVTAAPVPVPAAAWMGMSLLGGLGVVRKLRRA